MQAHECSRGFVIRGSDAGCRLVFPNSEEAVRRFGAIADAPPRHEGTRNRCIGQMDRDGVVQYASLPARSHCPSVRTSIVVEPVLHLGKLLRPVGGTAILTRTGRRRSVSRAAICAALITRPGRAWRRRSGIRYA